MLDKKYPFSITDNALIKMIDSISEEEECLGIKVKIIKGGCMGHEYSLEYIYDPPDIGEKSFKFQDENQRDLLVAIDSSALLFLFGATIDYYETELESGFNFINKNNESCGCGTSYRMVEGENHYELFDIQAQFSIDVDDLTNKFHAMRRKYNPDSANEEIRKIFLNERIAIINRAYNILLDPLLRSQHLLHLYNIDYNKEKLSPQLLMKIMQKKQRITNNDSSIKQEIIEEYNNIIKKIDDNLINKDISELIENVLLYHYIHKMYHELNV